MQKKAKPSKRWASYERSKGELAQRVARSGKSGADAARLYELEIKRLCKRLRM